MHTHTTILRQLYSQFALANTHVKELEDFTTTNTTTTVLRPTGLCPGLPG